MERRPAPPQPYIMLTVATSLTACTKTPSSFGSSFAISSAPSVEGVIGIAEEVAAAGEERADRGGVGALGHERPRLAAAGGARPESPSAASAATRPGPEELRRVHELEVRSQAPAQAVGLGARASCRARRPCSSRGGGRRERGRFAGRSRSPSRCSGARRLRCSARSPCSTAAGGRASASRRSWACLVSRSVKVQSPRQRASTADRGDSAGRRRGQAQGLRGADDWAAELVQGAPRGRRNGAGVVTATRKTLSWNRGGSHGGRRARPGWPEPDDSRDG